VSPWRT